MNFHLEFRLPRNWRRRAAITRLLAVPRAGRPASCAPCVSLCAPPRLSRRGRQNVRAAVQRWAGAELRGGAAVPRAGLPEARRGPPETPQQLSFAVRIVMAGNGTLETKHVTISKTFPGPLFLLPPYAVKRARIDPPTPKTLFKWKKLRLKYANNRCSGHGQWHGGLTLCFGVCL